MQHRIAISGREHRPEHFAILAAPAPQLYSVGGVNSVSSSKTPSMHGTQHGCSSPSRRTKRTKKLAVARRSGRFLDRPVRQNDVFAGGRAACLRFLNGWRQGSGCAAMPTSSNRSLKHRR
jgi:hypothetical protein